MLMVTKMNGDGTITIIKTVPCDVGSATQICLVEVTIFMLRSMLFTVLTYVLQFYMHLFVRFVQPVRSFSR